MQTSRITPVYNLILAGIQKYFFKQLRLITIIGSAMLMTLGLSAQIVINEIMPSGTVELKNTGTTVVNVADYWLCDFPSYQQISSLTIECGNTMMAPGSLLAINDFNTIDGADGEMGLFTDNNFGSPTGIIDYVEWGSSGHVRASVADEAGIWSNGDFVPV